MTRAIVRVVWCGALVCLTAAVTLAQTTTTSETKKFQVISVDGNQLVVRLPEGTREMTVPEDFRFTVDGKSLSVHELRAGMSGTATITTRTTVTPVTVTEVKNGTVLYALGQSIIVRTSENEVKQFTQSDIDKRGVKIMREGKPAEISDFRANDRLTATIITSKPPRVMTEREVQATLAKSGAGALWRDFVVKKTNRERLFATTLMAGVASLGVPMAIGTLALTAATDALAQDYTNANLTGTIVDDNGAPVSGATVAVTSDAQGFTRTSTTDANGNLLSDYTQMASVW